MTETNVTLLLQQVGQGHEGARNRLIEAVYAELRQLARGRMRAERAGHTLDPTELVNEACVRLFDGELEWENRAHFFGAAALAMRRILIEHARKRSADKRGGDQRKVTFDSLNIASAEPDIELLALDEALDALAGIDEDLSRLVHLRFFAGLTIEETAEVTGVSTATANRKWAYARAWLYRHMGEPDF